MDSRALHAALAAAGVLCLAACSDPIIGTWVAKETSCENNKTEFTVNDELTGDGTMYFGSGEGCISECKFDLEVDEDKSEDSNYEVDIELDDCACPGGEKKGKAECKMNDDETEMDCTLEIDGCDTLDDEFEKKE